MGICKLAIYHIIKWHIRKSNCLSRALNDFYAPIKLYNKLPCVPFDMKVLNMNVPNKKIASLCTALEFSAMPDIICNQWMSQTFDLAGTYINDQSQKCDTPLDDTDNMLIGLHQKKTPSSFS
jgi:hypothetical protein